MDAENYPHTNRWSVFKQEAWEWIKALLIAAAAVALLRTFLFTPTIVSGPSMEPNFHDRDRLIVNKIIYTLREPKRGEVIVFHAQEDQDYIKRVIALPGETVKVDGDQVWINGQLLDEPYISEAVEEAHRMGMDYNNREPFKLTENGVEAVTVPEGTVFVMGDNRSNSKDSRSEEVGFIAYDRIVGRADLIFWPLTRLRLIDHGNGGEP